MAFEEFIKSIIVLLAATLVAGGAYVGYRYAMMWLRRYEQEGEMLAGRSTETDARLEALETHLTELQERLDFAERLLTQSRESERLPGTLH
jgi:Tfp pilus assembly protein PilO